MTQNILFLIFAVIVIAATLAASDDKKVAKKVSDPNDNKGLTPFFLQDPTDETCLGPTGFTICDENALWLLTRRQGKKTYSLVSFLSAEKNICWQQKTHMFGLFSTDRLALGSCNSANAKAWKWDFIDQNTVKLSTNGQCVVRGRKGFQNSVSLTPCNKGNKVDYLPLTYVSTAVHENGFYIKAADGTCFDGSHFRPCSSGSNKLLFGLGLKYIWGEPQKYFFHFAPSERSNCVVTSGNQVEMGACSDSHALSWGLDHGRFSFQHGKQCVVRNHLNKAYLARCSDGSEYMTMEVPSLYNQDYLQELLRHEVC